MDFNTTAFDPRELADAFQGVDAVKAAALISPEKAAEAMRALFSDFSHPGIAQLGMDLVEVGTEQLDYDKCLTGLAVLKLYFEAQEG